MAATSSPSTPASITPSGLLPLASMQMCPRCSRNSKRGSRFCGYCGERFTTPEPLLAAGLLLHDRYRILRLLGVGGMGTVYLGEDTLNGSIWAIKSLFDLTMIDQFILEAQTLHRLAHPQLPRVIDLFEDDGFPYFVMEYVDGKSLDVIVAELQKRGSFLPVTSVVRWGIALCEALSYIHGQTPPIIHRDIKPDNIKFTPAGVLKLVDFGLLKIYDPTRGMTSRLIGSMGSEGYTAYEQYLNNGTTGPATDVYALGGTLYNLLTNRVPPSPPERMKSATSLQPPSVFNPAVPKDLDKAITTAMAFDIADRFSTAALFAAALAAAVPEATARPAPSPPSSGLPRPTTAPTLAPPLGAAQAVLRLRGGAIARTPEELAHVLDRDVNTGMFHLYNGDLVPWFLQIGRADLAERAATICRKLPNRRIGLEAMIRLLDPHRPAPRLELSATALAFGLLLSGTRSSQPLEVRNAGRGFLHGKISSPVPWLTVTPDTFGCERAATAALTVTVETGLINLSKSRDLSTGPGSGAGNGAGSPLSVDLTVQSNGGSEKIPVSVSVRRRGLLWILGAR